MTARTSVFASMAVMLTARSKPLRDSLKRNRGNIRRWSRQSTRDVNMVSSAFKALASVAGTHQLAAAFKVWGEFGQSLDDVRAKTGATAKQVDALGKVMRENARQTKFTARETGEAATYLAQAGLDIRGIHAALRPVLDAAAATGTSVQETADIVTNVQLGMKVAERDLPRVADVLAMTTASANTNLVELGEAFANASATARYLGLDVEEVAAGIGILANAGIKSSRAGTVFRMAMVGLTGTTQKFGDELVEADTNLGKQDKVLKRLGVTVREADGSYRDLFDIIKDMNAAGATSDDIMAVFGSRAGSALLTIKDNLPALDGLVQKLRESRGAAEEMSLIQMSNLVGDTQKLKSAWQDLQIEFIDTSGAGEEMRRIVQAITRQLTGLKDGMRPFVKDLKATAQTLAPLVSEALGYFKDLDPAVYKVAGALVAVRLALVAIRAVLSSPKFLIISGSIAAVDAFAKTDAGKAVLKSMSGVGAGASFFMHGVEYPAPGGGKPASPAPAGPTAAITMTPPGSRASPVDAASDAAVTTTEETTAKVGSLWKDMFLDISAGALESYGAIGNAMDDTLKGLKKLASQEKKSGEEMNRATIGNFGTMLDLMSQKSRKAALFKRNLALFEAATNIYTGITAALKLPSPWRELNIAAVSAIGATQISLIRSQKIEGQAHGGLDNVPRTGTWILEEGEAVIQRGQNERLNKFLDAGLQEAGEGEGGATNIYIDATDAASFQEMLANSSETIYEAGESVRRRYGGRTA